MPIVDLILIGAVIVFAWAGWARGFVAGLLSFIGFLGGGILAALVLPSAVEAFADNQLVKVIVVGVGIIAGAVAGQVMASILGRRIRSTLTWKPVRFIDNAAGAALNVLALALVVWILAMVVVVLPSTAVSEQVANSRILTALDSVMPAQVRNAFSGARNLMAQTSAPRVFAGLVQASGPQVDPPDDAIVADVVDATRASIVRISGATPECNGSVTGSGFVVAPHVVATNAHVVAGVRTPLVRVRANDSSLPATVVYFDARTDIALLKVPDLSARSLPFSQEMGATSDAGVVAGFPGGGPFAASGARVRARVSAVGDDIYGNAGVDRDIYVLRATLEPGDSGGPLLDPDGRVWGMVFGADQSEPETAYALAASELRAALDSKLGPAVDVGNCRVRD